MNLNAKIHEQNQTVFTYEVTSQKWSQFTAIASQTKMMHKNNEKWKGTEYSVIL